MKIYTLILKKIRAVPIVLLTGGLSGCIFLRIESSTAGTALVLGGATMKKAKLLGVILPWLCLFQNFSVQYEHTVLSAGAGSTTYVGVNSHLEQPVKAGRHH